MLIVAPNISHILLKLWSMCCYLHWLSAFVTNSEFPSFFEIDPWMLMFILLVIDFIELMFLVDIVVNIPVQSHLLTMIRRAIH